MPFSLAELILSIGLLSDAGMEHLNAEEVTCLAQNIYHEARGEPFRGRIAVAHVTLNRVESHLYPDTICGVVYEPDQFSWTVNGPSDLTEPAAFENALIVAIGAMSGLSEDPTYGATHYFNPQKAKPHWSQVYETTEVIGRHIFQRNDTRWR
ncbi:cell wall hydrolase [Rhodobacteraceae bacterium R_SAG4]|nr:cell wall hydrolase [Rhodobacteraceae bacterium R_SAG4]